MLFSNNLCKAVHNTEDRARKLGLTNTEYNEEVLWGISRSLVQWEGGQMSKFYRQYKSE